MHKSINSTFDEGQTPVLAFDTTQITSKTNRCQPKYGAPCHPLAAGAHAPAIVTHTLRGEGFDASEDGTGRGPVCFSCKDYGADAGTTAPTLRAMGHSGSHANAGGQLAIATASVGVRRLTPIECERLQGFPDDYTRIPWRKKAADQCPDGNRYKALGNSMAVPVMAWIGSRIAAIDALDGQP